jgi:L-asparagine transporter-like permease
MGIFDKKSIPELLARAEEEGAGSLRRGLGSLQLTALGVGAIIGAGIFVVTGQAAALHAGPAIVLSFVVAGIACAFAALCYAELASMIPVSGSAYTYTYATIGEIFAWIIAWVLMAEYLFAAAAVSVGWSGYFAGLLAEVGIELPAALRAAPLVATEGHALAATGALINLPAVSIIALVAFVLVLGVGQSAAFNATIVALKVSVVVLVIVFGFLYAQPENWVPFIPPQETDPVTGATRFGTPGIFAAAGVIFFAYLGFDTVSTAAQEARNPQRSLPIGILASLGVCTFLYVLISLAITGMAPFRTLNVPAPIYAAVQSVGLNVACASLWAIAHLLCDGPRRPAARSVLESPSAATHPMGRHADHCGRRVRARRLPADRSARRAGVGRHAHGLRTHLRSGHVFTLARARPEAWFQDSDLVADCPVGNRLVHLSHLAASARDVRAHADLDRRGTGRLLHLRVAPRGKDSVGRASVGAPRGAGVNCRAGSEALCR